MGVGGFGVAKYSFWGQNDIVLTFLDPKRRRFSHQIFFFKLCKYTKTTLFWTLVTLNDVILSCIKKKKMKQRRFGNEQF